MRACSHVDSLRQFIVTKLDWYLEKMDYRISCAELKFLLKVVHLLDGKYWEQVLGMSDEQERKQTLQEVAKVELEERRKAL